MIRAILASTILCGLLSTAPGAEFDLSWHSIDGGGAMRSAGGAFELSGTIGQPDAGRMSSGAFQLTGGFWFELAPTDCNEDGAVNLFDHTTFTECLTGPHNVLLTGCECFDVDLSGAVDLRDFAMAQVVFSSP